MIPPEKIVLKKSLGQHFLHDKEILENISSYIAKQHPNYLLEVGAGGGALTDVIQKIPFSTLKVVEIDAQKVALLKNKFSAPNIEIVHGDVLEMRCPFDQPFWVVGNFPYYISSPILFQVMQWRKQTEVKGVVCMLQKEVAQRICSPEGSKQYGITSVLLQSFFDAHYLFDVPPTAFHPPPKVMSGVIALHLKEHPFDGNESKLKQLVKVAFNQRRKMLRNAVKGLFDPSILSDAIFSKRPEHLSLHEFYELVQKMK